MLVAFFLTIFLLSFLFNQEHAEFLYMIIIHLMTYVHIFIVLCYVLVLVNFHVISCYSFAHMFQDCFDRNWDNNTIGPFY